MELPRARPATDPRPDRPAADGVDRLSALDDATLHDILGRLPLRDAAATTVLSRRWPRVFATVPRLVLRLNEDYAQAIDGDYDSEIYEDYDYYYETGRWADCLDSVLKSRAAPVAALEIQVEGDPIPRWFDKYLRRLCRSGLQELDVFNISYHELCKLPPAVYACATLTSLELTCCQLRVPATLTGLRALRSLVLRLVVASDADLNRIIAQCRTLERLEIFNVHGARSIVVCAPSLEKLEITSYHPLQVSMKNAPRLDTVLLYLCYEWWEDLWCFHDAQYAEFDLDEMAERDHRKTDEIRDMVTFLAGIGAAKKLHLNLSSSDYVKVMSKAKVPMPRELPKTCFLLGLKTLILCLDHNHEMLAKLVACLLNSSPNLEDLSIIEDCDHDEYTFSARASRFCRAAVPLSAGFWEEHINARCVEKHLKSFVYFGRVQKPPFVNSLLAGHPCGGLCQFLVANARVLKRMSVQYLRHSQANPGHAARVEAVRSEIQRWPRASPDLLLELRPLDDCPCY